ncbi:MAG: hypothetical protein WCP79_11640 [Bacillota bacterium]
MVFHYANLRVAIENNREIATIINRKLEVKEAALFNFRILKRSLDARDKTNLCFVYTVEFETNDLQAQKKILKSKLAKRYIATPATRPIPVVFSSSEARPIVVGFGPAGMFAAYQLAKSGFRPIVYERGSDVDIRTQKVAQFWRAGILDTNCNVQFGEGGAGTFSDGKLTCRLNDPAISEILKLFVECGAPEEITWLQKPHIGTDVLRTVVKNIRAKIIALGGEIIFDALVKSLNIENNAVVGITANDEQVSSDTVFLGIGHSARDTYEMLYNNGVRLETKPFAVGVRIEHPQAMIDKAQFGEFAGHSKLGTADYALVFHDKENDRTAYSFCMCPGGKVVAAASEVNSVVVNGMSNFRRDSGVANAALVVTVDERDFGSHPLAGIVFQRQLEQAAFIAGGMNYNAPVQTVGSFLNDEPSEKLLEPTYLPGSVDGDLRSILPEFVTETLAKALVDFGRKIKGFDSSGAILTAVETRTSAPCRIVRSTDFQAENIRGLYPIGEGAGYAGGIMSAALDGMNAANAFMSKREY